MSIQSGLFELGPQTDSVSVRGKPLVFRGLNVDDFLFLMKNFQEVIDVLTEKTEKRLEVLTNLGSETLANVVACACDERGNKSAVKVAKTLSASKQLEIVEKIFTLTFEDGVDSFLDRLGRMAVQISKTSEKSSSEPPSENSWSASLVGDEPRRPPERLRRVS